jgi:hypothetical protein
MDDLYDGFICDECHQSHEGCNCGSYNEDDMFDYLLDLEQSQVKENNEPKVEYYYQTK